MHGRFTLREAGNVPKFIQVIVERLAGNCQADFYDKLYAGLVSAANLPDHIRTVNQCRYETGVKRWASDLLSELVPIVTSHKHAH